MFSLVATETKAAKPTQINIITINVGKVKNIQIKNEPDSDALPPTVPQVDPSSVSIPCNISIMSTL